MRLPVLEVARPVLHFAGVYSTSQVRRIRSGMTLEKRSTPQPSTGPQHAVEQNIQSVVQMDQNFERQRTLVDRVADAIGTFSGSMWFVGIHVVWFALWFLINTGVLPFVPKFDPYPFILLAMVVSVEGVLLSTFVLMKQNRMQQRSDARHQLDLQINLLAEKEVTKALQLLRKIAEKMDLDSVDGDAELEEMARVTSVDSLSERIGKELPSAD